MSPLRLSDPNRLAAVHALAYWEAAGRLHDKARRVDAELETMGVRDRACTVEAALATPAFSEKLDAAIDSVGPVSSLEEVRPIAFGVLSEMGVDTTDVLVTLFWDPPKLRFAVRGATPEARARAAAAVEARAAA